MPENRGAKGLAGSGPVSTEGLFQLSVKALERLDQGLFLNLKLKGSCHKKKYLVHATT